MRPLFLYGTLRHRPLLDLLSGGLGGATLREGVLPGYWVVREEGGHLPVLAAQAEGSAHGLLVEGLPRGARERLDAYELPFGYAVTPVTVRSDEADVEAEAYLPPEGMAASGELWDLEAWLTGPGVRAMRMAEEIAATDPPLLGDALRRQWGMIGHRAAAQERAAEAAPVTVRHGAGPGDLAWRRRKLMAGSFFRLDSLEVNHRRFDGGRNEGLLREVMVGADAALILPYDPARDRVLLVEQVRTGPMRRGDPEPWILEPVAGLVDANETPEEAARREAEEEAGLVLGELVPMFRGYASPGNATDHFYAYLALCDLPDGRSTSGGLEEEQEDLRLHVLPFQQAMGLLDSGEANAVPLISMLLWLDRWKRSQATPP